jgi:subtilisin
VTSWSDDNGHGTHVAGTIAAIANRRGVVGVAPHARLYAVKVLKDLAGGFGGRASGKLSWILNGLAWCYRNRMHIVNLSLGSGAATHNPGVYNIAYERIGQRLRRLGILCVASAGNDNHHPVGNPARCPSYMAVSAIDRQRRLASFSSVGPQVEICAPGVRVMSTFPRSNYKAMSGTSMAAPHVTGVAALVKRRRPTWHGDTIRVHLRRTAIDLGRPGRDWAYGYGQVHAWRAVR